MLECMSRCAKAVASADTRDRPTKVPEENATSRALINEELMDDRIDQVLRDALDEAALQVRRPRPSDP